MSLRAGLGLIVAAIGCSADTVGPDRGDPAQYAFEEFVRFSCGSWYPEAPQVQLGLFDVHFPEQRSAPADEAIRRLTLLGGTIVHRYHVNAVRAVLSPMAAEHLGASAVRGVTDPADLSVDVAVGFHELPLASLLADVGGTVTYVSNRVRALFGVVPDAAIPILRQDARVRYVESTGGGGCFDVSPGQDPATD